MEESDWEGIEHEIPLPARIIDREESTSESEFDDEEIGGEKAPELQLADKNLEKDQSSPPRPFNIDTIVPPAKQQALFKEIDEKRRDAEYTLTTAFESRGREGVRKEGGEEGGVSLLPSLGRPLPAWME